MNKTQLIDALAARIGDRRTAANAVDGLLSTIVDTVKSGESVSLTGFGVFESRARAARVGRNPRTGETVAVPAATVPAFRPGTGFRTAVSGPAPAAVAAPAAKPTKAKAAAKAKPTAKAATKAATKPTAKAAGKSATKAAAAETTKPKKKAKK
jgi:DNA-binding protein HU-beta